MTHHRALILFAFVTIACFGSIARAQRAVPVDCPTVYDSQGTSLGLARSSSQSVCVNCMTNEFDNRTVARVAMEADGEVFEVTVFRDHLTGTLREPYLSIALFDGPDCTGNAYSTRPVDGEGSVEWEEETIGPFLPSIVVGPSDSVYLLDPNVPRTVVTIRSGVRFRYGDARSETCENSATPSMASVRQLRKVAELSPDYQAPFRIESGPCPRPGRR